VSKPEDGVDARVRDFTIEDLLGHEAMSHGRGYVWGGPDLSDVWGSVEFSEIQHDARGQLVLDARGKTSDGSCGGQSALLANPFSMTDRTKERSFI